MFDIFYYINILIESVVFMKKILGVLLFISVLSCSACTKQDDKPTADTTSAQTSEAITLSTSDAAVSETMTESESSTIEDMPENLESETTVSETTETAKQLQELVFEDAVELVGYDSNIAFGDGIVDGVKYHIWSSTTAYTQLYGIKEGDVNSVIIAYDGKTEIIPCDWYGVYSSVLQVSSFGSDIYTILYKQGGSYEEVYEMTQFTHTADGYQLCRADPEKLIDKIKGMVNITIDEDNNTATFASVVGEFTVSTEKYTNRTADGGIFTCRGNNSMSFTVDDGLWCCTVPYSYMLTDVALANLYFYLEGDSIIAVNSEIIPLVDTL